MGLAVGVMLDWIKKHRPVADPPPMRVERSKRPERTMTGKYLLLYNYLENRYADTVVLTFSEIEDLLGFSLPEEARLQRGWWLDPAVGTGSHTDSWILASRTAIPDLMAKTVVFDRLP